jgi:preprotein translocase subunit SecA
MPTPSDRRRIVHVRRRFADPKGLDLISYSCIGWWKRAPWKARGLAAIAGRIDKARDKFSELDEGALNARLIGMRRRRLAHPGDVEGNLEEGLALLAVAAHRQLGLAAYRVQLMAAVALVRGFLTEVDTGEGKTLALALAAAYQAWSGKPCHVITANDYLAERDARQLKSFYEKVGLSVASVLGETQGPDRREGYACSVTYTTAKEVAADYLRDRLSLGGLEASGNRLALARLAGTRGLQGFEPVQRGLFFALIDEADNALIDEAVTPLIISRTVEAGELELACKATWAVAETLERGVDYQVNYTLKTIEVPPGHLEEIASQSSFPGARLWSSVRRRAELLRLALEAREFFRRDEQYVINDEKVVIVDEATGRQMPMRTWRQGLHQMIEAKEGVPLSGATETIARISFQSFFRKYENLAGASGTVSEVAAEIWRTYGLPVIRIPRNLPNLRQFLGTRFHATMEEKAQAIAAEVKVRHARGQPVLLGMRSVEASEGIAELLAGEGLSCHVLNARRHREEAGLIMRAGHPDRITIATNMAGRGTDIKLDPKVEILGGLHVVASEPHESARVDRQLFGRAARHGDPGSVLAFYSAEDPLFVRFVPARLRKLWIRMLDCSPRSPMRWVGQVLGRLLLDWSQFRSQSDAVRRRRQVMKTETELIGNLGFSRGVARSRVRS